MERDVYEKLKDWLNKSWAVMPASEDLMPLIRVRFSTEEAEFLTGFPYRKTPTDELARMKGMDQKALEPILDDLASQGKIWKDQKNGKTRYGLNDLFFSVYRAAFWPGREDGDSMALAPPANNYILNGMMEGFSKADYKGLRTIPIAETVHPNTTIKPYEDVVKLLDSFEYYTVSACPCRHRKNLDPRNEKSKKPLEVCLHFDALGHYIVENGLGREITREETEEILSKSAKAGLVHGLSNWLEKPDTICNCDKDDCFMFESYHKLDHNTSLNPSEFVVVTHSETCKGCGLCTKRCPMEALQMVAYPDADPEINKKGKVSSLDPCACLGCGVCVVKCPTQSLILKPKTSPVKPPKSARDWVLHYLDNQKRESRLERKP
jgi:formate hydrogenlyase subunit 6/NADH:ubiquinone oxidoreductase subunit I